MTGRVLTLTLIALEAFCQSRNASVTISLDKKHGLLAIDQIALGQGGLSADTIWEDRAVEVKALRPRMIRLFVQEYFDLMPEKGRYNFSSLDRSVDLIR